MAKLLVLIGILAAIFIGIFVQQHFLKEVELPPIKDEFFGPGKEKKDKTEVEKFEIFVSDEILEDLKIRLQRTKFFPPLENSQFGYGFNTEYLKKVHKYWMEEYDWRKHERKLNEFPQFRTEIEGLKVHFLHVKPPTSVKYQKIVPLLLVHGWPGSVWEFYKIIPILTDPARHGYGSEMAFEVIAPSIPGYGWSDAPSKKGFGPIAASRIFAKLMQRLKFDKYFAQGGDWGSLINTLQAIMYPDRVIGVHLNMAFVSPFAFPGILLKQLIGTVFPGLVMSPHFHHHVYPLGEKFFGLLQESGYMHIQATKPDTVGFALHDSPLGLAAYILEKFTTWTNKAYVKLEDGGLTRHFSMDELLTNIMIYWTTGTIASSQRFYKEAFSHPHDEIYEKALVHVPSAISIFPQEITVLPCEWLKHRFTNLTQCTEMQRGGHFAAFEEPKLLGEDLFRFAHLLLGIHKN